MTVASPEPGGGSASGLDGTFSIHAATQVGGTVDIGTGIHGPELANNHFWLDPELVRMDSVYAFQLTHFFLFLTLPDPEVWYSRAIHNETLLLTKIGGGAFGIAADDGDAHGVDGRIGEQPQRGDVLLRPGVGQRNRAAVRRRPGGRPYRGGLKASGESVQNFARRGPQGQSIVSEVDFNPSYVPSIPPADIGERVRSRLLWVISRRL